MKRFYLILAIILVLALLVLSLYTQTYIEGYVDISKIDIQSNFPERQHESIIKAIPELEKRIRMIKKINIVKKNDIENNKKPGILKINGKDAGSIEQIYKGFIMPIGMISGIVDYIDITLQNPDEKDTTQNSNPAEKDTTQNNNPAENVE